MKRLLLISILALAGCTTRLERPTKLPPATLVYERAGVEVHKIEDGDNEIYILHGGKAITVVKKSQPTAEATK